MPARIVERKSWSVGAAVGGLTAALMLLVAWSDVSPARMRQLARSDPDMLLVDPYDDWGRTAATVLRGADSVPVLLTLGASAMREAFADRASVEEALVRSVARQKVLVALSSSSQTLLESASLVASYRLPRGSVVLIHVDPDRLRVSGSDVEEFRSRARIPFLDTPKSEALLRRAGLDLKLVWAPFRLRAWWAEWLRNRLTPSVWRCGQAVRHARLEGGCVTVLARGSWITDPPHYSVQHYPDSALSARTKDSLVALAWLRGQLAESRSLELGAAILAAITQDLATRGCKTVIVRLPADSRIDRAERGDEEALTAAIQPAREAGADWWDLRRAVTLPDSAFHDLHHIRSYGRLRLTQVFVDRLAHIGGPGGAR